MRKAHYVWLISGDEKTLTYYYENPDTHEWGYGFNIANGGGFIPETDLTDECKKYILELIDILMGANTQTFDDSIMQHEHYIFDRESYYRIDALRNKLSM